MIENNNSNSELDELSIFSQIILIFLKSYKLFDFIKGIISPSIDSLK